MDIKEYYDKKYIQDMDDTYRYNYAERVMKEVKKYKQRGKLLDLGCGSAIVMKLANECGFESYGMDICEDIVAKEVDKTNIIFSEITDLREYEDKSFDVIVAFNIIAHLRTPAESLEGMKRILKDDGVIILSTPNIDTWIGRNEICTKSHLNYFNYNVLVAHCDRVGLKIIYNKSRLLTVILFRLLRRCKSNIINNTYVPKKKSFLDSIYKFLEFIDFTHKGMEIQVHLKKK